MQNFQIVNIICTDFIVLKLYKMTKKQEALNKAKQSWKTIVEGWKELWVWAIEVVWWTTWAIWYTLLSGWEKIASKVWESRANVEWITAKERKKHRDNSEEYNERAKQHIVKAWELGKMAIKWTWKVVKWWGKVIWYTVKWWYHLIDAWDKAIWKKIEKKQMEKWKRPWKVKQLARDNIMKILIALWLAWYWWYKTVEAISDKQQDRQEIVIKDNNGYEVSFEEKEYYKNPDFFNKEFKTIIDERYINEWVSLIRDAWMTFYIVQDGETKKEQIRKKLSSIPEFSYLKDSLYDEKIKGFNVPDASLKKWLYIPIPVQATDRKIDIDQFREYSQISLQQMKNDPNYWEKTKKLIEQIWEEQIINIMIAFARCETAMDQKTFTDPIWTAELHRWEPTYRSFSFSYYHILMEKNADWRTPWPWLKARQNLWLTEWQCYHPINAGKLFLWYCFEKVKSDPTYFFKIRNLAEAKEKWWKYNWDPSYWQKLRDNINYVSKK